MGRYRLTSTQKSNSCISTPSQEAILESREDLSSVCTCPHRHDLKHLSKKDGKNLLLELRKVWIHLL